MASLIKFALNLFRGVPTILYALLMVNIVGLGPLPGTLAVAFGSFCMMTKMFAEVLETLDPGPIEAVRAVGARPVQVFVWGMLPQALPNFLSLALYVFEFNLGASFILGLVGGGGIGYELQTSVRLYRWDEACVIMLVIMVMVVAVDSISYRIRAALA
jgi:phosphonate transport system permease protein